MKTIVLAFIALTLSGAIAQSCNNPLGPKLGLTLLSSSADPAGARFCRSQVNAKSSCCSAETINSLQTKIDDWRNKLQTIAGSRDGLFRNIIRNNDLQNFQTTVNNFKDAYLSAVTSATMAGKPYAVGIALYGASLVLAASEIATKVQGVADQLVDYQNKRVACFRRTLRMQAASYCLACNPNWQTMGVNLDATITLSPNTCTKLQDDCGAYLIAASATGSVIAGRKINRILNKFIEKLNAWKAGAEPWPSTDTLDFSNLASAAYQSTSAADQQVALPSGCSDASNTANCNWICENFFAMGQINIENIGRGGKKVDDDSTGVATVSGISRILATTGSFSYDDADDGMTTDVVADPSASGIKTVFSAVTVLLVSIVYLFI